MRSWESIPWEEWQAAGKWNNPEAYLKWRRMEAPPFLFSASEFPQWRDRLTAFDNLDGFDSPIAQAKRIRDGWYPYYSRHWLHRGIAPDWFENPFSGERAPTSEHWSRVADKGFGDIKNIWELSRFSWVYPLVRAFARDGDVEHAETFWRLFEDWLDHNPPNRGLHWMCGQEISIRLMAWCFALYGFIDTEATTPGRLIRLTTAMAESGRRIEVNLDYALSQKNNHGISECVGLITIGRLFPEIDGSADWFSLGMRELEKQVGELFYADGSFSQHSSNYERVALHALCWVRGILSEQLSSITWLDEALAKGSRNLFEICESETGHVPNSGGNDGALLLPLSNCLYGDYRPIIQAGWFSGQREGRKSFAFSNGAWDEELLWLGISQPKQAEEALLQSRAFDGSDGGSFTIRHGDWSVVARAPRFRHRPAHADLLHLDLCWQGHPIAIDAGSYSYRADGAFAEAFKTTRYHNTVEVDGISQMEPVGRFMLLPWATARLVRRGSLFNGKCSWMLLEHDTYRRLSDPVRHQRAVVVTEHCVLVVDLLQASCCHNYRLHWLLEIQTEGVGFEVGGSCSDMETSTVIADKSSALGWQSKYYMEKEPARSVIHEQRGSEVVFFSIFSKGQTPSRWDEDERALSVAGLIVETRSGGIQIVPDC